VRLAPRSLRFRLTAIFTLGAAVVVAVALALLYVSLDRQLATTLDVDLRARAGDVAEAVLSGNVEVVSGDPMCQLYSADGTLVASSPSLDGRRLLPAEDVRGLGADRLDTRTVPAGANSETLAVRVFSTRLSDERVLSVGVSTDPLDDARQGLLQVLLLAAPLLLAVLAAAGWLVMRAALRPVDELTREAEAIASFETDRALPAVPGDDEIARLAATLDRMLGRLTVAFRRERAFVDDASHELRTPIAVLRGEIELALLASGESDERERSLRAALGEAERLSRLAEDLLLLARERAGSLVLRTEPVDLLTLVASEADRLGPTLGLSIRVSGTPAVVLGDPDRLRQVVTNLLDNSATAGAGTVSMTGSVHRGAVTLEIADDGPGFPPAVLGSAFERFVRGDEARTRGRSGAGLGLSIVRAVVTAHGGTIEAGNGAPLGGAVVTLRLPLA
jgi:two-component system, OmpR family, sensor kinase